MNNLSNYRDAKVVVTGHTGFKGSWLIAWLKILGAKVTGIALDPPTTPSHYDAAVLSREISDFRLDIRSGQDIKDIIINFQPDYLFHLAAQPLVRRSYENPHETWETNLIGTLNVLEALRQLKNECAAVIITSDKCYDNVEWVWGYRENDTLGGADPYSASKGAAELLIKSHIKSFFNKNDSNVRISSARAGNVIGGGDWAKNRIIPDCVSSWSIGKAVCLRNPYSTRPWQHVLEPLSGYLSLAMYLKSGNELHGESFNFGPLAQKNHSVLELVDSMAKYWDKVKWHVEQNSNTGPYESDLLKLNCDKALHFLDWHAVMGFDETVKMTAEWYRAYYQEPRKIIEITNQQISEYMKAAKKMNLSWAKYV